MNDALDISDESCPTKVNQYSVQSCLELADNPRPKSVVLEASVETSLGCQFGSQGLVEPKVLEPLTQCRLVYHLYNFMAV